MAEKILQIVTNNPEIYWSPEMPYGVVSVEGDPIDVLDRTEELLQHGWRLLSAPLPPNVPIMRGPYRSLVIEESDRQYGKEGMIAIEGEREISDREEEKLSGTSGRFRPYRPADAAKGTQGYFNIVQ